MEVWSDCASCRRLSSTTSARTASAFSKVFPFLSPRAEPARPVGGVLLEMRYRTPSATAFMPLLFVLAVVGAVVIARPGAAVGRASLRIPVLGALAITSGMLLVGYIAPRYIVEFLPALRRSPARLGSSPCSLASRPGRRPRQFVLAAGAVVLALFGGGCERSHGSFVGARRRRADRHCVTSSICSAGSPTTRAARSTTPSRSVTSCRRTPSADELFIVGACQALLVGTGELYRPWIAARRVTASRHRSAGGSRSSRAPVDVVRFDGCGRRRGDHRVR